MNWRFFSHHTWNVEEVLVLNFAQNISPLTTSIGLVSVNTEALELSYYVGFPSLIMETLRDQITLQTYGVCE